MVLGDHHTKHYLELGEAYCEAFAASMFGPDGIFGLCADLWHPDCIFDLRQESLSKRWERLGAVRPARRAQARGDCGYWSGLIR